MNLILLLPFIALVASSSSSVSKDKAHPEKEARIEADIVSDIHDDESGNHTLKMRYHNDPKELNDIFKARVRLLTMRYCRGTQQQMDQFMTEHGPVFWGINKTDDSFYTLADHILSVMNHTALNVTSTVRQAIHHCEPRARKTSTEAQRAFWILECIVDERKAQRANVTGDELDALWDMPAAITAALDDIASIVECAQVSARLALTQLDVEYKQDAIRKAHALGRLTEHQLDEALVKLRVPNRADYLRSLVVERRKARLSK